MTPFKKKFLDAMTPNINVSGDMDESIKASMRNSVAKDVYNVVKYSKKVGKVLSKGKLPFIKINNESILDYVGNGIAFYLNYTIYIKDEELTGTGGVKYVPWKNEYVISHEMFHHMQTLNGNMPHLDQREKAYSEGSADLFAASYTVRKFSRKERKKNILYQFGIEEAKEEYKHLKTLVRKDREEYLNKVLCAEEKPIFAFDSGVDLSIYIPGRKFALIALESNKWDIKKTIKQFLNCSLDESIKKISTRAASPRERMSEMAHKVAQRFRTY